MKHHGITIAIAAFLPGMASLAQDPEPPAISAADAFAACIDGTVDMSKPESERSRAESRAVRRCEREAERVAMRAARAEDDADGLICRRESVVGTHQRVRVCTTREERESARNSAREVLQEVSRDRGDGPQG